MKKLIIIPIVLCLAVVGVVYAKLNSKPTAFVGSAAAKFVRMTDEQRRVQFNKWKKDKDVFESVSKANKIYLIL